LKNRIQSGVLLQGLTTFHIGGPADFFLEARTEQELIEAVSLARSEGIPYFLLGGGSNLVVSSRGIAGMVIHNRSADPDSIDAGNCLIKVSSGKPLSHLVGLAYQSGFHGLESLTGIPGSVGGAIYGNAGAYGTCIGDVLVAADVLDADGRIRTVDNSFFRFAYRTSYLKSASGIILNATLKGTPGNREEILIKMNDIIAQRKAKHPPYEVGSAGSFFQNLPPNPGETRRRAAGEVLEKAGAKQLSVGGASVYHNHANFIVNYGKATSDDVKQLAVILKEKVMRMFEINLREEVLYIGK